MDFNKILAKTSQDEQDNLLRQALNKREYNKRYQAKLRKRNKQLTLERKIDSDVLHAINYIKDKYTYELEHFDSLMAKLDKMKPKPQIPVEFSNWLMLASSYRSGREAYEVSNTGLGLNEFLKLFEQHFELVDNKYIRKLTL